VLFRRMSPAALAQRAPQRRDIKRGCGGLARSRSCTRRQCIAAPRTRRPQKRPFRGPIPRRLLDIDRDDVRGEPVHVQPNIHFAPAR
jgi:hypothetical protein